MSTPPPNGQEIRDEWPRRVELNSVHGRITIEAHRPWCQYEQSRQALAVHGLAWPGFYVECMCNSDAEKAKWDAFLRTSP